jgi:exopolysaccharide production protein ExoZ
VPNKLDGLQALRAFAAIIVVLEHCLYRGSILAHVQPPPPSPLGAIGVQLFFVLSGLLMGRILLRGYDPLFLAARALRIFPPYWAAVLVGAFLCAAAGAPWTFDWKAFLLVPSTKVNDSFNIPYWTLIYEVCFYCLVYLLIMIRATRDQVNVVALSWASAIVIYFYCFGYFSHVLPGAWISVSTMNLLFIVGFLCGVNKISLPAALPRPLLWLLPIVLWTTGDAFAFPEGRLVTLVLQAGAAGVVVLLMAQPTMRIPRALVSLGNASYGVYLIHFIVIERMAWAAGFFGFSGSRWLAVALLFFATLPFAVVFGVLEHALHEGWAPRLRELKRRSNGLTPHTVGLNSRGLRPMIENDQQSPVKP